MAKYTTDDYKSLDIRWLAREGFVGEYFKGTTITWSISGRKTGSVSIIADNTQVRFIYTYNKTDELDYIVKIDKTSCNYGGFRYWFICPKCSRRVAILYSGKYFLCRHCLDLTYRSCQEHDKRVSFLVKHPEVLLSKLHAIGNADSIGKSVKKANEFFRLCKALDKIGYS